MRSLRRAIIAAIATGCAHPCFAGDATCLWRHLPPASRDEALRAYESGGRDALDRVAITDDEVSASLSACGVRTPSDSDGVRAVGGVLVGITLQEGSANVLISQGLASASGLEQAWRRLPVQQRRLLETAVVETLRGPRTDVDPLASAVLDQAIRNAGWRPDRADSDHLYRMLLDYFQGRAQQEAFSPFF